MSTINFKRIFFSVSLLIATCLFVWFVIPKLIIYNQAYLINIADRLHAIAAVAAVWLIFHITFGTKQIDHKSFSLNKSDFILLKNQLDKTFEFLTGWHKRRDITKSKLPCFILLGHTGSGKSSLLKHCELHLTDNENQAFDIKTEQPMGTWWFNQHAVFCEMDVDPSDEEDNTWEAFCHMLSKRSNRFASVSIIVTTNMKHLYHVDSHYFDDIKNHLAILSDQFGEINLHVALTHCDAIAGFNETFTELSVHEREQLCGILFNESITPNNATQTFHKSFHNILEQLHKQVMMHVHREHSLDKREMIHHFPYQIERLEKPLLWLTQSCLSAPNICMRGLYFTSAEQQGPTDHLLEQAVTHALNLPTIHYPDSNVHSKPFFIHDLFQHKIFQDIKINHHRDTLTSNPRIRKIVLVGSGSVAVALIGYFSISFYVHYKQLQSINQLVAQLNQPNISPLSKLNTLHKATTLSKNHTFLLPFKDSRIQATLKQHYHIALQKRLLPQLVNIITQQLRTNSNVGMVYNSLAAYIMFHHTAYLDKRFIEHYFTQIWSAALPNQPNAVQLLQTHLHDLLKTLPHIDLDKKLVQKTRQSLLNVPLSQLVITMLENNDASQPINLIPDNSSELFASPINKIPNIYSTNQLNHVYFELIPDVCAGMKHGNWVLGNEHSISLSDTQIDALISSVRNTYFTRYKMVWSQALDMLSVRPIETLQQASSTLRTLALDNSPLFKALIIIAANTAPSDKISNFNGIVSTKFTNVDQMISNLSQPNLINALNQLSNQLATISQSPNILEASFNFSNALMQKQTNGTDNVAQILKISQSFPDPLKHWLTRTANQSLQIVLSNTAAFINQAWSQQVFPDYTKLIANRYPIVSTAHNDINLNDFIEFFGTRGRIMNFIQTYLKPFVNSQSLYWTWRNIDGQKLPLSQTALDTLIRANLIHHMFFPNQSLTPHVSFNLRLINQSPLITGIRLMISNHYPINFTRDHATHITWPTSAESFHSLMTLSFNTSSNIPYKINGKGPWALFRILDRAKFIPTHNTLRYIVNFDLSGMNAEFDLTGDSAFNPFIPGILDHFRPQETLS